MWRAAPFTSRSSMTILAARRPERLLFQCEVLLKNGFTLRRYAGCILWTADCFLLPVIHAQPPSIRDPSRMGGLDSTAASKNQRVDGCERLTKRQYPDSDWAARKDTTINDQRELFTGRFPQSCRFAHVRAFWPLFYPCRARSSSGELLRIESWCKPEGGWHGSMLVPSGPLPDG